jgi:hypothetical protein
VTIGTGVAVAVAAVIATVLLAACGGGDDSRMRARLTADGCTYRGDTTAEAGRFTIEVENQNVHDANFAFVRLANGFTAATIKPILARESAWLRSLNEDDLRNMEQGKPALDHPRPDLPQPFDYRFGSVTEIGSGASSELPGVGVPAGSYAVICRVSTRDRASQLLLWKEQYFAAQIEVTGALPGVTTP